MSQPIVIRNKTGDKIGAQQLNENGSIQFYDKQNNRCGTQQKDGILRDKTGTRTNKHPIWG